MENKSTQEAISRLEGQVESYKKEIAKTESGERRGGLSEKEKQEAIKYLEEEKKKAEEELSRLREEIGEII